MNYDDFFVIRVAVTTKIGVTIIPDLKEVVCRSEKGRKKVHVSPVGANAHSYHVVRQIHVQDSSIMSNYMVVVVENSKDLHSEVLVIIYFKPVVDEIKDLLGGSITLVVVVAFDLDVDASEALEKDNRELIDNVV